MYTLLQCFFLLEAWTWSWFCNRFRAFILYSTNVSDHKRPKTLTINLGTFGPGRSNTSKTNWILFLFSNFICSCSSKINTKTSRLTGYIEIIIKTLKNHQSKYKRTMACKQKIISFILSLVRTWIYHVKLREDLLYLKLK
jgi:hypothetical protein